jgi:putative peptide zinc metalloprotease protein
VRLANWKQLKVRSDLVISTQTHQGKLSYVVKDPVTLRYFRIRPTEYAVMKMLDGHTPISEVKERLVQLGHDIPDEELQAFLQQLGAANFFENVLPNQSDTLYRMALLRRRQRSLWQQVKRILYIKIPVYDPDRLFNRVMPYVRFFWSKTAVVVYMALILTGAWIFITNFAEARANFSGLYSLPNFVLFGFLLAVVFTLHELGHGLTCKYFGGEVHEMGMLLLMLAIPCLYCNVSDVWIQEKRHRKFFVSAAGILTELVIASIAALVWWATEAGVANSLAFRLMIVAGIHSLVFNMNPLMRFDGYYILSDALAIPNLRSSSVRYMKQFFRKYILGLDTPGAGPFSREDAIRLVYGIASSLWIFYVMYKIVRSFLWRLPPIGIWILVTTVYGLVLIPIARIVSFIAKRRGKAAGVKVGRAAVLAAVIAAIAYVVFFLDIGYAVSANCVIQPGERHIVYAATGGTVSETFCEEGDSVIKGQIIAKMEDPELQLALKELGLTKESYLLRADQSEARGDYPTRDYWLSAARELDTTVEQTRGRIADLVVRSPADGVILAPSGRSLVGRTIPQGGFLFDIADMSRGRITVAVDQKDLRYVAKEAQAVVTLRAYPWTTFSGTVQSVSKSPLRVLPDPALSARAGGGIATRPDVYRWEVALSPTYEATILLPNDNPLRPLKPGMVGKAKIAYGESRRIWEIVYLKVRQNLRRSFGI